MRRGEALPACGEGESECRLKSTDTRIATIIPAGRALSLHIHSTASQHGEQPH